MKMTELKELLEKVQPHLDLPWVAKECPTGWEICVAGPTGGIAGWLFKLEDRADRATEKDKNFIESQEALMEYIVTACNALPELIKYIDKLKEERREQAAMHAALPD